MLLAIATMLFASRTISPFEVRLGDGSVVKLVSVSDYPSKRAWTPDGRWAKPIVLDNGFPTPRPMSAPEDPQFGNSLKFRPGQLVFLVSLELKHKVLEPQKKHLEWTPTIRLSKNPLANSGWNPWEGVTPKPGFSISSASDKFGPKRWVNFGVAGYPSGANHTDVGFEIADSQWRTFKTTRYRKGRAISGRGFGTDTVGLSHVSKAAKQAGRGDVFPLRMPKDLDQFDHQIVAYDAHGNEILNAGSFRQTKNGPQLISGPKGDFTCQFFDGKTNDIAVVKLRIRPWRHVLFRGVRTSPNAAKA